MIALVTGASRGIGAAIAKALAAEGHSLLLVARDEEKLREVAHACVDAGAPKVEVLAADLATYEGLDATVLHAVRTFDGFDILVNNAGVGRPKPTVDVDDDAFDHEVALNLRAPFMLTQSAIKIMRKRGGGQVVQIGSGLSYAGRAGWAVYAATKFGLRGFTECIRQEVAAEGIKVGLVAPGYVETDFFDGQEHVNADWGQGLLAEDVAHAVMAMVNQGPRSNIKEITVRPNSSP